MHPSAEHGPALAAAWEQHHWLWWVAAIVILVGTGAPGWTLFVRRWRHRHDTPADRRRRRPKRRA
jgi:uncharacterized membrane protein YhaH (DUF805 family)